MRRFWYFLTDIRTLTVIGFAALAATLMLSSNDLEIAAAWVGIVLALAIIIWLAVVLYKRWKSKKEARALNAMLEQEAEKDAPKTNDKDEIDVLRKRMQDAISTIKTSKLGEQSGSAALYELPWYMVIGNPAAGKSTAITNSGLQFPLADKNGKVINGIGGTRNCDWFFTTDGIFLDTAGRYAVHEEDRKEWFGFLSLLKKYRKLAPINGIIIAVSITEITSNKPEFGINLAKNLRQRVQELTEKLEVFAPVYIVFTKADMIAGFHDFFLNTDNDEKERVWGATHPYSPKNTNQDVLDFFDERFDELYDGLKQMSMTSMSLNQNETMPSGVFTFPLEFASKKAALRAFIATMFEENPFQFKPVFRGFYFTSALQEDGAVDGSAKVIASRFNLNNKKSMQSETQSQQSYFLLDLFRKVICADKNLVRQYASRNKTRLRYVSFFIAAISLGLALGAWSWSYVANTQLTANVEADLEKAVKLQENKLDLQSRFEALDVLQTRIEQLETYREDHPISLGFGLYQGGTLERKLRDEYFSGIKEIMLNPVGDNLEAFLAEMNASNEEMRTANSPKDTSKNNTVTSSSPYKNSSPNDAQDAYNALKTYLMLSDKSRAEPGHLIDQLTRFWRSWLESNRGSMSRDQMISNAERLISFYLAQIDDPAWPTIESKPSLVDISRDKLTTVTRGMPARERVYAEVKARATTRFATVTVASIVGDLDKQLLNGSYAIPGTFTREAWDTFISKAFKEAANKEMQTTDWVLKTSGQNDLTLEGSPEQIEKALIEQYKLEYTKEWQKFIQGISVADLSNFEKTVSTMNRLGDPQSSPINKLITKLYEETSWDNPSMVNEGMKRAQRGFTQWFKQVILRRSPARVSVDVNVKSKKAEIPMGPIGKEFSGIAKLVVKDGNASLMTGYLANLSKLRSRFNVLKNQGDTGPGAKKLMEQTLSSSGSELSDSLKYIDEQMLVGMTDSQKQTLRPILVRPLIQAFSVIIKPTASEINRIWQAQVYEPFNRSLASKYPFTPNASLEATSAEIAQIFGSTGAVSKFFSTSMAPLIVRRGDTLSAKTWADKGLTLSPEVLQGFNSWVAPLSSGGVPTASNAEPQWAFQLLPNTAPGTTEYTIEIDGQTVRYRNTQAQWSNLVWPNNQGTPGARITATNFDGRVVEVVNFPGQFGFKRLMDEANKKRKGNGVFELSWDKGDISISADLKIISKPELGSTTSNPQSTGYKGMVLPAIIASGASNTESSAIATTKEPK